MTKTLYALLFFMLYLCCMPPSVYGQRTNRIKRSNSLRFSFFDSTVDSLENLVMNDGFFYGGAHFMSHVNSVGRDNNINQWAFSPIGGFQKQNLDIYFNTFRWSQTAPKWAETDLGISKMWQLSKIFNIVTTYEHAFVRYGSDDDKYGLDNLVSTQLGWTNKLFEIDTRYEYDWGRNIASILEFSIGHQWSLYDVFVKDKVEITPRFYLTYLGGNTYPVRFFNQKTNIGKAFQIANYEIELPVTWRKMGKVEFNMSFNMAIPKNVMTNEGSGKPIIFFTSSLVKIIRAKQHKVTKKKE